MTCKRPYKLVEVVWEDAHCSTDMGDGLSGKAHAPVITYSVGYQIKRDRVGITIAQDCYEEGTEYRVWSFIPRKMIVEINDLTLKTETRKSKLPKQPPASSPLPADVLCYQPGIAVVSPNQYLSGATHKRT